MFPNLIDASHLGFIKQEREGKLEMRRIIMFGEFAINYRSVFYGARTDTQKAD